LEISEVSVSGNLHPAGVLLSTRIKKSFFQKWPVVGRTGSVVGLSPSMPYPGYATTLGLDHNHNRKSIMYPSYSLFPRGSMLPDYDRQNIQTMYGASKGQQLQGLILLRIIRFY
jgi:hypothetical protein